MLPSTQSQVEQMLETVDRLGIVKIKHLQEIHKLNYRNLCRIITTHLRPFIHETYYQREKVIYLNKRGREMIDSDYEVTVNSHTLHSLMRNEVYIHFNCPQDWKNEYVLESNVSGPSDIQSFGLTLSVKKKVVADAMFRRNGYMHLIEVDNERKMIDNRKKIESYREVLPSYKGETPMLYFFTKTESRKRKLAEFLKGIRHEVLTFDEIK